MSENNILERLSGFDYTPRTRIIFGENTLERVGELAKEYGASSVLLVTDPGIVEAGHTGRATSLLEQSGLSVTLFDRAVENPTTKCVDECVALAKAEQIDFIVGLGGGSSMDTAKGCNFILTNGGRMQDYWGVGKATKPMLPLIAIPTTAGTGSECQSFALISDEQTHSKMACGDFKAAAKVAILDPLLTLTQPNRVAACTGIDALAHAVETMVTKKRNPLSLMFSKQAFKLLSQSIAKVFQSPDDLKARGDMLLGAALAGTAIENSMLGAAHSAANPLTAHYGVVHGEAVGMMLPTIVRFNSQLPEARQSYFELARMSGLMNGSTDRAEGAEKLATLLEGFLQIADMPQRLSDLNITEEKFAMLAREAAGQWTATFNPREIDANDFEKIYESILN